MKIEYLKEKYMGQDDYTLNDLKMKLLEFRELLWEAFCSEGFPFFPKKKTDFRIHYGPFSKSQKKFATLGSDVKTFFLLTRDGYLHFAYPNLVNPKENKILGHIEDFINPKNWHGQNKAFTIFSEIHYFDASDLLIDRKKIQKIKKLKKRG